MEQIQKVAASSEVMVVASSPGQAGQTVPPQEVVSEEETIHPPQSVGREFVRQYYTMLHRAPEQLHRFYSQNSSFLHEHWDGSGPDERPAVGQIEIYERIKTMNFRDCHAKIFQVDSQLSVCHTVVVQVLGELSNSGEPLRKFMQTFVLVPQTNKKYYVHNDIFRYQDEGFEMTFAQETPDLEYNNGVMEDAGSRLNEALYVQQVEEVESSASVEMFKEAEEVAETEVVEEVKVEECPTPAAQVEAEVKKEEEEDEVVKKVVEKKTPLPAVVPAEARESSLPPQKLSWAEMASRNVGSSFRPLPPKVESRNGTSTGPTGHPGNDRSATPPTAKSPPPAPQQPQQQPPQQPVKPTNQSNKEVQQMPTCDESTGTIGRGMQFYPDQQQIFVGNLPHYMSDQDLKEFFEKYGKVLDLRINRKPNNSLPNFGFIAFDSAETVKYILSLRPLYNGKVRVNVEEKKKREDLLTSRPRSGNPAGQSPDCNVANGSVVSPHRDEMPKTNAASQGSAAC